MRTFLIVFLVSHVFRSFREPKVDLHDITALKHEIYELRFALAEVHDSGAAESCYVHSGRLYWFLKASLVLDALVILWILRYRTSLPFRPKLQDLQLDEEFPTFGNEIPAATHSVASLLAPPSKVGAQATGQVLRPSTLGKGRQAKDP